MLLAEELDIGVEQAVHPVANRFGDVLPCEDDRQELLGHSVEEVESGGNVRGKILSVEGLQEVGGGGGVWGRTRTVEGGLR